MNYKLVALITFTPIWSPQVVANEAEIHEMTSEYTAAVAAGDLQRFLSVFSDDVVVMPPDHPTTRGLEAFTAFVKPFFDQFTLLETISYDEIRVAGD